MSYETGATAITWWAVVSAFGGTLIGGGISYYLARMNLMAAKKQRDEDRREVRKALGLGIVFKMIRLSSELNNLGKSVSDSLSRPEKGGFKGMPFQVFVPTVPLPEPIYFSPNEMALILSIDNKLFNELGALDELHNSTVAIFGLYNTKRNTVLGRLGAEMNGNIGTTMLTAEQKRWFDPRAVELNQLVEVMIERTRRDTRVALTALDHLSAVISKEFAIDLKFERKPGVGA